jgi:hypothetical protein
MHKELQQLLMHKEVSTHSRCGIVLYGRFCLARSEAHTRVVVPDVG